MAAGAVKVGFAAMAEGAVAVEAGVDGPGGDAPEESGWAVGAEVIGLAVVGLGQEGDAITEVVEEAGDEGDAEGRVVDIGIGGDEDDVGAVPVAAADLIGGGGEKGTGREIRWARPGRAMALLFVITHVLYFIRLLQNKFLKIAKKHQCCIARRN